MTKTVYLYDPETLKPKGAYACQPSPLEPGEYITPTHSLPHPPPAAGEGQAVYFNRVDDWIVVSTPMPTPEDVLSSKVEKYRLAARQHMTTVARSSPERFNSISEAKSFVGTDNPLSTVSAAFQKWSALVISDTNNKLAAVLDGNKELPELEAFINSLPKWSHPNG